MVVAIVIAALNFYLSAVRPLVFRRRNGSLDGYKHISGIPAPVSTTPSASKPRERA